MNQKKLLYISEDHLTTRVHHHLCEAIGRQGLEVTLFVLDRYNKSVTEENLPYKQVISFLKGSVVRYKYDFSYKISHKYHILQKSVALNEIDMVCAATLFSEGALAYKLFKNHGIPYVVMVRNTDYNFYFRKMIHLWPLGKKILRHAQKVIFIAPYYRQATLQLPMLHSIKVEIEQKSLLISNGIDPFWVENRWQRPVNDHPNKILFVGNFSRVKNVPTLIRACALVKNQYADIALHIVGGGGNEAMRVERLMSQYDWIHFHGRITDKTRLKALYRESDLFAMPSHETFGLVFVEALTQGMPIIYGKNSGFDYRYEEGSVGYATLIGNEQDIADKIKSVIQNYAQLIANIQQLNFDSYDWDHIAKQLVADIQF